VINSTGGILQELEACLLVGFQSERLPRLLNIMRTICRPYRQYVPTQGSIHGEMANPRKLEAILDGTQFYTVKVE
jgi:uncharacterized protein YaaQ